MSSKRKPARSAPAELVKENLVCWVVGQKGSGKSHWMKHELIPKWDRVLVVDPMAEYASTCGAVVESPAAAKDWLLRRGAGHHLMPFRLACVPHRPEDSLAYLRIAWATGSLLTVVEEVDQIAWPSYSPPELRQLIQRGRHRRVSIACATQRPSATPIQMRSQADLLVAFRLTIPQDLQAVEMQIPGASTRLYYSERGQFLFRANAHAATRYGLNLPLDRGTVE